MAIGPLRALVGQERFVRLWFELAQGELVARDADRACTIGPVRTRLAQFLLDRERAGLGPYPLGIPRRVLARALAMRPETLCRVEAGLRAEGLIEGKGMFVKDRAGLSAIAG